VFLAPSAIIQQAVQSAARDTRLTVVLPRLRARTTPVVILSSLPTEEEVASSAWDPEPVGTEPTWMTVERTPYRRRSAYETELLLQEIEGCRGLLLELIRRAAFDWVLYRSSTRLLQRQLAGQAYEWIFIEVPGHPSWSLRIREGKTCMSFVAVCESLDLDPDTARAHIRKLTPSHVMSTGRPSGYKTRAIAPSEGEESYELPDGVSVEDPVDADETFY
jgi:hypothetical protein